MTSKLDTVGFRRANSSTCSWSNSELRESCRSVHDLIVKNVTSSSIIDRLFAARILGDEQLHDIESIVHRFDQTRRLMLLLHRLILLFLRKHINDKRGTYSFSKFQVGS